MLAWLVAVVLFFLGSIAVSQYAQGRVQRGDSRFAHLLFAPRLVIYVGMFVLGLRLSIVSPIVGIPFTLGALILVGAWVRAGMAVARGARAGRSPEELAIEVGDAAVEPLALYGILVLVGGFLTVVALIVFGVAERLS